VIQSTAGTTTERRVSARPKAVSTRRADRVLGVVFLTIIVALYAIVGWAIYVAVGALF
jgi:hypothetical protein